VLLLDIPVSFERVGSHEQVRICRVPGRAFPVKQ